MEMLDLPPEVDGISERRLTLFVSNVDGEGLTPFGLFGNNESGVDAFYCVSGALAVQAPWLF